MSLSQNLDPYLPGSSLVHRLDPRVKVGWALGFILAVALTPPDAWPVSILLVAIAAAVAILAEMPAGIVLRRAAMATPFALSALPLLFTVSGYELWTLPWGWTVTYEGAVRCASVVMKTWLSVIMAGVLTATTRMPVLLGALRALGVPRLLVATINLMWRYLFVLVAEARRLMHARSARSAASPRPGLHAGGSIIWRAKVTGSMAGSLFLRALDRADRTYGAMVARGYDGDIRTLRLAPLTLHERLSIILGLAGLGTVAGLGLLLWG